MKLNKKVRKIAKSEKGQKIKELSIFATVCQLDL